MPSLRLRRFLPTRPPLRGELDGPESTVVDRGHVVFRGWALVGSQTPTGVDVVVNHGRQRISAGLDHDRPDVPLNLGEPSATTACGWTALVDLSSEPAGDLRVQIVATGTSGRQRIVADRLFALRGDGVSGRIEIPANGAILEGDLLLVRGWASSVDGLASIDIELDGNVLGQARLGLPRLDVHESSPGRYGPACGFEFRGSVTSPTERDARQLVVSIVDQRHERARLGALEIAVAGSRLSAAEEESADRLRDLTARAIQRSVGGDRSPRRDVLVFTHSLALGGGELYLQDLLRGMLRELERCTLVTPAFGPLGPELESLGVDVVVRRTGIPHEIAAYEGAIRELALFISASGSSCVLLNTVTEWMAAEAAQRAGVPTIWAIHESFEPGDWLALNFDGAKVPPYIRSRFEAALRNASRLVFEATATRSMYTRIGVPEGAALTMPYGIDIDAIDTYAASFERDRARSRHDLPLDATVLLSMGVFQERKSQAWLVQAFESISKVHPHAVLVLVGDHPSPYSQGVHDVINALGLSERVRTVPITADVWEWYALADILVSTSDVESLPRSMLEAMALGCPVLASAAHGIPELITDGETGWLMRPRDNTALVAGLHRVLRLDAEQRRSISEAAREQVAASYRTEQFAAAYLRLIDELEAGS